MRLPQSARRFLVVAAIVALMSGSVAAAECCQPVRNTLRAVGTVIKAKPVRSALQGIRSSVAGVRAAKSYGSNGSSGGCTGGCR